MNSRAADNLLWVLTAQREMPWRQFRAAFDELFREELPNLPDTPEFARVAARQTLDALGHAETNFGPAEATISISPAVLADLPMPGLPVAVLCGARAPSTESELKAAASRLGPNVQVFAYEPTENSYAPTVLTVRGHSTSDLEQLAEKLGVHRASHPAALALIAAAGDLAGYTASLRWETTPEWNWKRSVFDPIGRRFLTWGPDVPEPRLVRYEHPVRGRRYRLWRGVQSAEVDLLWARYLVFHELQIQALRYDDVTAAALAGASLPRLFARALTLCTGTPVSWSHARRAEEFSNVPPDFFNIVARKLGQPMHAPDPHRR